LKSPHKKFARRNCLDTGIGITLIEKDRIMNDITHKTSADGAVYKTLLESTKAIPWKIDWDSKAFTYIGPQIEELLGWTPESWMSVQDWADRMHEEDREYVVNFCVSQSMAGIDHEADYRALTKDGGYVWLRDVVHVVRKPDGEVDALVGFMFDISDRKRNEEKLLRLQKELEDLSYKDGLTGVANRRQFDSTLLIEWSNAQRTKTPLSLIMFDIDYFKQYNDHYGHIAGDDCLKRVGQALRNSANRPRDFFARFGGEEFVLILPETDATAAQKIADRARDMLARENIEHVKSLVSNTLTVSMGVGTITPGQDDQVVTFITAVDRRLYDAKQLGRNRIVAGT
jgi:diguanylate cyclase (GGDEF)-like protein/PAS domain S-box-containing protein